MKHVPHPTLPSPISHLEHVLPVKDRLVHALYALNRRELHAAFLLLAATLRRTRALETRRYKRSPKSIVGP